MLKIPAALLTAFLLLQTTPADTSKYVCPPCGCSLDGRVYDQPGICSACDMAYVKQSSVPPPTVRARRTTGDSTLYDKSIRKVNDGVYLAYRPDPLRTFVEGNVTIIVNERDVMVVDAGGSPLAARNIIAEIRKLTPNPVRYVFNTHFHYDHTLGNQEWIKTYPGLDIVAQTATRDAIAGGSNQSAIEFARADLEPRISGGEATIARVIEGGGPGVERVAEQMRQYFHDDIFVRQEAYKEATITPPTTTFESSLSFTRGPRRIQLLHLGHGDTPGDAVIYLPDDKVVCTGDMVVDPIPYGYSVEPLQWIETLKKLEKLDFDVLIPGHGDIKGKPYVRALIATLESIQTQMRAAVAKGLDLDAARRVVDISAFEKEQAGDDPVKRYYLRRYFFDPATQQAFNKARPAR